MIGRTVEKISGGKLVKLEVEYDNLIRRVKITGDFFAYPEDVIEKIEKSLVDLPAKESESVLLFNIDNVINNEKAELVGVSAIDIARLIRKVIG